VGVHSEAAHAVSLSRSHPELRPREAPTAALDSVGASLISCYTLPCISKLPSLFFKSVAGGVELKLTSMNVQELKETVVSILRTAGEELMKGYGNVASFDKKSDAATDIVTDFDRKTEEFIKKELATYFPGESFYGEEFGGERSGTFWLLDPIDGTGHYVRGMPFCSTMLTFIKENQVVFSAINSFPFGKIYVAAKGDGAYCNGEPIHVSDRSLRGAYIAVEINQSLSEFNKEAAVKLRERAAVVNTITAGYEFAMTAEGRLDGRVQVDPYGDIYDFAVGSLLVSEAGGAVANIGCPRGVYDYRNLSFLSTNKKVFEELTEGSEAIFSLH